uniref:Ovule protein n=1 Tax=Haemonchus placei TaxID=6290 RepID=A0A0N4WVE3_HAEPC
MKYLTSSPGEAFSSSIGGCKPRMLLRSFKKTRKIEFSRFLKGLACHPPSSPQETSFHHSLSFHLFSPPSYPATFSRRLSFHLSFHHP